MGHSHAADGEAFGLLQHQGARRSPRALAAGLAALTAGLGVGVGAWAITGSGPGTTAVTQRTPGRVQFQPADAKPEPIPAGSPDALAAATPGAEIAPLNWVASVRALARARPAASGTLRISVRSAASDTVAASQAITFSAAASGEYDIRFPGNTAFATADGAQVQVLDDHKVVQVNAGMPSQVAGKPAWVQPNGELELPNDAISRVLYPDKWIEVMAPENEMTVRYAGGETVAGRDTRHYRITFGVGTVKYAPQGWDFWLDAESGVLVRYLIHYSDVVGGGTEEAVIDDLSDKAASRGAAIPAGYRVEAAVHTEGGVAAVKGQTVEGDTASAVVARARQAADVSGAE